jgi:integrase
MALSELGVSNAKASDKPVHLFDGGGVYLEVAPSGGKWWRLKYRHEGTEKRLSLPARRMKMKIKHLVPLSAAALRVIAAMRSLTGSGPLVFPSPFYPCRPLSDGTLNSALARIGYKGLATAHGFRTLFSTCAHEAGWNTDVIEMQLAHEDRDEVRRSYNRAQWIDERAKLMRRWAERVTQIGGGGQTALFELKTAPGRDR